MTSDARKPGDPGWKNPALAPHPGEPAWMADLRRKSRAATISQCAKKYGVPRKLLSQVLNGEADRIPGLQTRLSEAGTHFRPVESTVLKRDERCAECPITAVENDAAGKHFSPLDAASLRLGASVACLNRVCSIERRPR